MKKEVGKRIKMARQMANLTRKQFTDKYNINYHTLESWEKGVNSVSEENLTLLEGFFRAEGINVSKNWILYGNTQEIVDDMIKGKKDTQVEDIYSLSGDLSYFKEIKFFLENVENSAITMVLDNSLFPFYCKGDYVGGIDTGGNDTKKYIGNFCIIHITNGDIVTRKVISVKENATTICSINPKAILSTPDYYTVYYNKIIPITRHWSCSMNTVYDCR